MATEILQQTCEATKEQIKVVYWTHPVFSKTGMVDTRKMIDFLIKQVPNNYFNEDMINIWNPWEEFEVQFLDENGKETITYACVLEIQGAPHNHSTVCTQCGPKYAVESTTRKRSEEISKLISGDQN